MATARHLFRPACCPLIPNISHCMVNHSCASCTCTATFTNINKDIAFTSIQDEHQWRQASIHIHTGGGSARFVHKVKGKHPDRRRRCRVGHAQFHMYGPIGLQLHRNNVATLLIAKELLVRRHTCLLCEKTVGRSDADSSYVCMHTEFCSFAP